MVGGKPALGVNEKIPSCVSLLGKLSRNVFKHKQRHLVFKTFCTLSLTMTTATSCTEATAAAKATPGLFGRGYV